MNPPSLQINRNRLLSALPTKEFLKMQSNFEPVKMLRGDIIYKSGDPIKYVYFPETCIFSLITIFDDGTSIESGIVGREGMTGAGIILSNKTNSRETFVQTSGRSLRIKTEHFHQLLEENSTLQQFVLNYASAFFEQVTQTGACSNHHSLTERLARLLLMCHDRVEGDDINITHEFIAQMLGAYRPNITTTAMNLKERKIIDYQRGWIKILDKKGLERISCECYEFIKECYQHYLLSLETRSLNQRAERAHLAMELELKRRREISKQTQIHVQNLKSAAANIRTLSGEYLLCPNCHFIRDENDKWHEVDTYIQKRLNVTISSVPCPKCKAM